MTDATVTRSGQAPASGSTRLALPRHRFRLALVLMVVLSALVYVGYPLLLNTIETPVLRIVINGQLHELDRPAQAQFGQAMSGELELVERRVLDDMSGWGEASVKAAFDALDAGVDSYLDWHFSALGSYGRLGATVVGDLDEWSQAQIEKRLLAPSGIEDALTGLPQVFDEALLESQRTQLHRMQAALSDQFADYRVPGRAGSAQAGSVPDLDFDSVAGRLLEVRADQLRVAASGSAALAVGGWAALRGGALASRFVSGPAMQQGRALVTRFLARLGLQAGRSAALAGGSAAATAPTGPGALVISGVVFATSMAAFAGTEYLALNAQEKAQRPELEAQLRKDIAVAQEELLASLEQHARDTTRTMVLSLFYQADAAQLSLGAPRQYRIPDAFTR